MLYQKIAENFSLNFFDIQSIEKDFDKEISNSAGTPSRRISNIAHWQYYQNSNVRFSRNFSKHAPEVVNNIVKQLIDLQKKWRSVDSKTPLIDKFLNVEINSRDIEIIKVTAGQSVSEHFDITRSVSLNIGLLNSNTCETIVFNTKKISDTHNHNIEKFSYIMNDGDVYLLRADHVHCVKSLNSSGDRYLITYNGIN